MVLLVKVSAITYLSVEYNLYKIWYTVGLFGIVAQQLIDIYYYCTRCYKTNSYRCVGTISTA